MKEFRMFLSLCTESSVICHGNASVELAKKVSELTGIPLSNGYVKRFADGEICMDLGGFLNNKHVVIIQSTCPPVNDHLMELLLMISTAKRAGASQVTAVVPYFGYARQTDKHTPGAPISSADVCKMIETMGADRAFTLDFHSVVCCGFFSPRVQFESFLVHSVAIEHFLSLGLDSFSVVSPDAGALKRATAFSELFGEKLGEGSFVETICMTKVRTRANEVDKMDLTGDVKGKNVILVDDMVDTAGTLVKAAEMLVKAGAEKVFAFVTHGLFSGPALDRIKDSKFTSVVVTDSILHRKEVLECPKIKVISVAKFIANMLVGKP
ncbi:ribose-phosphate pyrophosphokinase 1, putative [Theileria equi strain WA]|uniref:ribose-phosphate diphosphokinase n=1 Tax=Theileria equi strain WA TaxID=1537102 RepID=L1LFX1_THEEQ|nr:ribose-phosphate pyrophosphokinase 1, putative [Theileria equi strain WA]EKX74169.1 ribose-phosphate pyrophosphokinase 1, putative [Theileria equi strain WA]|eukprot:XP_004833621.1 ribose-phosphate pyrophosphokinase 1, putative [Theileria equi strain WA]